MLNRFPQRKRALYSSGRKDDYDKIPDVIVDYRKQQPSNEAEQPQEEATSSSLNTSNYSTK